jgi:hypothetical protein
MQDTVRTYGIREKAGGMERASKRGGAFRPGAKFLIKLNELEAARGVVIVGHRLEPFRDSSTPTAKLVFEDASGKVLRQSLVRMGTTDVLRFFTLYGEPRMVPRLVMEDVSNAAAFQPEPELGDPSVHVFALDLRDVGKDVGLAAGDYLSVTMLDAAGTRFKLEPLPICRFDAALKEPWWNALSQAFMEVFATGMPSLDPIELAARAYQAAPPLVVEHPGGAYSEFFNDSGLFGIFWWQGAPVVWDSTVAPEVLAQKMDATYSSIIDGFSDAELDVLQDLAASFRDVDEDCLDEFSSLARDYNLSVDSNDIELFLTVELSQYSSVTKLTEEALRSNAILRELVTERAAEKALVALRLTGISESGAKALRASAREAASEILDNFDLSVIKNPVVNNLREALMDIYERFLLWMRTLEESFAFASESEREKLEKNMVKMNELLNVSYMLNEPELPDDRLVKDLLKPGSTALAEYWNTLEELESLLPSQRAKRIPERGRVPSSAVLTKQGYKASRYRYGLEIVLKGAKPRIYRTLLVPGNRTLADLHRCLQDAFGWKNYHLHEFRFDHMTFGEPSGEDGRLIIADDIFSLDDLALKVGNKLEYVYDLGDNWVHSIKVTSREKLDGEDAWTVPCTCLDGARAAPPEDCGGIDRYTKMLKELAPSLFGSRTHTPRWDPERFDKEAINKKLARR